MKYSLQLPAILLTGVLSLNLTATAVTKNAFLIGNSFTNNTEPQSLPLLASQQGNTFNTGWHINNGSPLHNIWGRPTDANHFNATYGRYTEALANHHWDAVTLQTFYKPPFEGFGPATMQTDIDSVLAFVNHTRTNAANSDTKFYVYSSWPFLWVGTPYQQAWDATSVDDLATWSSHKREYYVDLIDRIRALTDAEINIIPVPEVLYELDKKMQNGDLPGYTGIGDIMNDNLHLDDGLGEFIAGMTTYSTIFAQDPAGITKPAGAYNGLDNSKFTPAFFDLVETTVWEVVEAHPYTGVPEPATAAMIVLAATVLGRRRFR